MRRAAFVGFTSLAAMAVSAAPARGQYDRGRDTSAIPGTATPDKDPLRGSAFLFDQSITTQTAHIGLEGPQSYVPFYGWWLSLRPRWWFSDELRVQARLDYYKEFTNAETTTYRDEDVFGDLWTDLFYQHYLAPTGPGHNTKFVLGLRAQWPTSKASQANGVYVTTGATAGVTQKIPVNGDDAPFLGSLRAGFSLTYWHPFSNSTTPTGYQGFAYLREDLDQHSFDSTQISGQTLAAHTLWGAAELGAQITPRLNLSAFGILVNQWHYSPTNAAATIVTGNVAVSGANDQQFTQLFWTLLAFDYEVIDEMSVGLGYYNLANTIASDGTVRGIFAGGEDNLFWSPDAHVFADVTVNLDKLYEDASGRYKSSPGHMAAAAQAARAQRVAGER